jgi:hypothetical protein
MSSQLELVIHNCAYKFAYFRISIYLYSSPHKIMYFRVHQVTSPPLWDYKSTHSVLINRCLKRREYSSIGFQHFMVDALSTNCSIGEYIYRSLVVFSSQLGGVQVGKNTVANTVAFLFVFGKNCPKFD